MSSKGYKILKSQEILASWKTPKSRVSGIERGALIIRWVRTGELIPEGLKRSVSLAPQHLFNSSCHDGFCRYQNRDRQEGMEND